jgi:8-oxo-dGTP pyrophosphatase MutT (NUDIX family)
MSTLHPSFWTDPEVRAVDPTAIVQVGALCVRQRKSGKQVLLVKSSRGRWIVPKGWPMDGHTDAQTAKIESWEEAGVAKGKVSKAPIGGYVTEKRFEDGRIAPCHVSVYEIAVKEMTDSYPEADMRKRKWLPLKKAAKKVDDVGLEALLRSLKR